jgi:hypothetical protein
MRDGPEHVEPEHHDLQREPDEQRTATADAIREQETSVTGRCD